jgi:RNA polymerase sigma-70 factor (ECF subfamily)
VRAPDTRWDVLDAVERLSVSAPSPEQRFRRVYDEHYGRVWAYVRRRCADRADADDVTAQVWLAIWRRIDDLPEGRELPWCYSTARRCLANHRRGQARRLRLVAAIAGEPRGDELREPDPRAVLLLRALATLRERDREVLRLAAWEQLAVAEIAVVLGTSPATVSVRLHRAKRRLARVVQELAAAGHTSGTAPEGTG